MDADVSLSLRGRPKHVLRLLEIRLRKLVDEREKMIEQVGH